MGQFAAILFLTLTITAYIIGLLLVAKFDTFKDLYNTLFNTGKL